MTTTAELISIGDELLYGQTLDTNSHWISQELDAINIKVYQKTTIGDNAVQILDAFETAKSRTDVILITGGLGPTKDDLTKPLLAKYFNVPLVRNEEALREIVELFNKANRKMTGLNELQADLPANCEKITNECGTAPGMWFDEHGKVYISMPGVPYEMKDMMTKRILPKLAKRFNSGVIVHRIIKTIGIAESALAELIENWESALPPHIKLAYLPTMGQVKIRLTATGTDRKQLQDQIKEQEEKFMAVAGKYVYGYENDEIESVVGKLLLQKKMKLALAESCTGGYISHLITSIPGSSAYFLGGIVSYANSVKSGQLSVPAELIEKHGAVSEEVVKAMAQGAIRATGADVSLAVSGIAGPDGGTPEKPVGTVWIGYADQHKTVAKKFTFAKNRPMTIHWSALAALNLLRMQLLEK